MVISIKFWAEHFWATHSPGYVTQVQIDRRLYRRWLHQARRGDAQRRTAQIRGRKFKQPIGPDIYWLSTNFYMPFLDLEGVSLIFTDPQLEFSRKILVISVRWWSCDISSSLLFLWFLCHQSSPQFLCNFCSWAGSFTFLWLHCYSCWILVHNTRQRTWQWELLAE